MSVPLRARSLYGLVFSLLCPDFVCFQQFAERGPCGWREMCVLSPDPLCPPPLIFPLSGICECVETWGKGEESTSARTSKLWAPPQASGLWAAYVWGSSLCLCFCCLSRCQNSVLLWGLNFWKPIKMCLLWVGSRASGCRPLPLFGVPLPPC